jgi:hypothetical protein
MGSSYHVVMKWLCLPVVLGASLALAGPVPAKAPNPQLVAVKTVYLLPMSNGFDQYLANAISRLGVLEVVTDPQKADAVFTDHVGAAFEDAMKSLYPPPAPPTPAKTEEVTGPDTAKKKKPEEESEKDAAAKAEAEQITKENEAPVYSTFSRGRGMVFLVDRHSRNVIWSTYDKPKDHQPKTLDTLAQRIARHLSTARNPPTPKPKSN